MFRAIAHINPNIQTYCVVFYINLLLHFLYQFTRHTVKSKYGKTKPQEKDLNVSSIEKNIKYNIDYGVIRVIAHNSVDNFRVFSFFVEEYFEFLKLTWGLFVVFILYHTKNFENFELDVILRDIKSVHLNFASAKKKIDI